MEGLDLRAEIRNLEIQIHNLKEAIEIKEENRHDSTREQKLLHTVERQRKELLVLQKLTRREN